MLISFHSLSSFSELVKINNTIWILKYWKEIVIPTYLPYIGSPFSVCIWVVVWNATPLLSVRYLRFIVFLDESNDDKEDVDEDENWFLPLR